MEEESRKFGWSKKDRGKKVSLRDDTGLPKEEFKKRNHIVMNNTDNLVQTKSRQVFAKHHLKEYEQSHWKKK